MTNWHRSPKKTTFIREIIAWLSFTKLNKHKNCIKISKRVCIDHESFRIFISNTTFRNFYGCDNHSAFVFPFFFRSNVPFIFNSVLMSLLNEKRNYVKRYIKAIKVKRNIQFSFKFFHNCAICHTRRVTNSVPFILKYHFSFGFHCKDISILESN